ncbi:MAG: hypothetical protein JST42_19285 [Bacteroidetes bacterium]|nr:hypothetical protein [Bacteroidota bacterium]
MSIQGLFDRGVRGTSVRIILLLVAAGCLGGCKKDNGPGHSNNGVVLTLLGGNNQSGTYGELLKDSIRLKLTIIDSNFQYVVKYSFVQGNGKLESFGYRGSGIIYPFSPDRGNIDLQWRLGCNSAGQTIKFYVYHAAVVNSLGQPTDGEQPLDSVTVTATGQPPTGWGRSCGLDMNDIFSFKIFTYDNNRLYAVSQGLFYSDDKGVNWYPLKNVPNSGDVADAGFNSKGWLYYVTGTHGVYYSQDLTNFQNISNGILDYRTPTAFTVDDSVVFVSYYFDGPYKTDNNGQFWKKLLVGGGSERYYLIRRHPNGSLYMFDELSNLFVSSNNGDSWSLAGLAYQYRPYQAYDLEIGKDGLLYIGADDATISVVTPGTYTGDIHSYYQYNASNQEVNNIRFYNGDVYYLVNYNPKPGIYRKSNNWGGPIDLGFNKTIRYYYIKNDGNFLLVDDALYYKN